MASDYVDDFLRDERESFKRKETAAKKFDNRLDNFRKSAQALRDAARQFEEAFPGMSRTMIADKLAMTGTEKSVAFDAKGELVAAPAGRKTVSAEPTVAPAADAATDPETTGSDVQEADDEPAPQEPAAEPDTSGRRTARMGVRQLLMIGRDARCDDHRREAFGRPGHRPGGRRAHGKSMTAMCRSATTWSPGRKDTSSTWPRPTNTRTTTGESGASTRCPSTRHPTGNGRSAGTRAQTASTRSSQD